MSEFDFIRLIQRAAAGPGAGVRIGIGDDAAVLEIPAGRELVLSTDTLNAGVHFFTDAKPADIGYKALAVNLSDLAAMGAEPRWALLSLSLPENDTQFLEALIGGFLRLAEQSGVSLVGGDTCAGPLSVTVTALGLAGPGEVLTRSGAKNGDLVVVSGVPGLAALALKQVRAGEIPVAAAERALLGPVPRIALGAALVGKATACIDISDGLLADLGHITEASGCGAVIEPHRLPCHDALADVQADERWRLQLTGGDDYELCFTLPPARAALLAGLSRNSGLKLTVVGRMSGRSGVRCHAPEGAKFDAGPPGYEHFT